MTDEVITKTAPLTAIIDRKSSKIYPANIKSILHLGGRGVHLFEEDMESIRRDDNKVEILGLPLPCLLPLTLKFFQALPPSTREHLKTGFGHYIVHTGDKCLGHLNFLCAKRFVECLGRGLNIDIDNWIACPMSPLHELDSKTGKGLVQFFENLHEEKHYKVMENISPMEIMNMLKRWPPRLTKEFFDLFIVSETNFDYFSNINSAKLTGNYAEITNTA